MPPNKLPMEVVQAIQLLTNQPILQQKLLEFLDRDPHPTAGGQTILTIKSAAHHFEWHTKTRNFYMIRHLPDGRAVGEIVAFNIETHGDALNAAAIWVRGYNEGRTPTVEKKHLQN